MSIKTLFQNIADAIKQKDANILSITPSEMPNAIINLPTGADIDLTNISFIGLYCTARRGGNGGYCQVSELKLSDGINFYSFPSDRVASEWGGYATGQGEFSYNMFDGSVDTKAILNTVPSGIHPFGWFCYLPNNTIDCTVYKYWSWYTANDSPDRDPISFGIVIGSGNITDGIIYKCVDFQNNYNVTTNRKALAYSGVIL